MSGPLNLLEKLLVFHLIEDFTAHMERKTELPCSKKSDILPHPEVTWIRSTFLDYFFKILLNVILTAMSRSSKVFQAKFYVRFLCVEHQPLEDQKPQKPSWALTYI
jgi:hypothetical protein